MQDHKVKPHSCCLCSGRVHYWKVNNKDILILTFNCIFGGIKAGSYAAGHGNQHEIGRQEVSISGRL